MSPHEVTPPPASETKAVASHDTICGGVEGEMTPWPENKDVLGGQRGKAGKRPVGGWKAERQPPWGKLGAPDVTGSASSLWMMAEGVTWP